MSWRCLLRPSVWWRVMRCQSNWAMWLRWSDCASHRCYCEEGSCMDGRIAICGFGINWFYSHFRGDVPCPCDRAIESIGIGPEPQCHVDIT
jgi:hypothetical protein